MRAFMVGLFLCVAVLFPKTGNAQVYQVRTPIPEVTAANAEWQINGSPVFVEGVLYYPTRGFREFDGQVMAQTGFISGVPVYADATLEPYSELYLPIGGSRMRVYERRRDGALAGTTGSRTPSFPVIVKTEPVPRQRILETAAAAGADPAVEFNAALDTTREIRTARAVDTDDRAPGSAGSYEPRLMSTAGTTNVPDRGRTTRSVMESIPRPLANNGIWLEFNGARWYAVGPATSFSPDRFEPVGEYRGFPVYRDKTRADGEIWIAVVKDGPVAPYKKR